jgi:hypothetical protein
LGQQAPAHAARAMARRFAMASANSNPILGKKLDWTFTDGQMKGKTFVHQFAADGSVSFKMPDSDKETKVKNANLVEISEQVYAVSYKVDKGYTLTVILNLADNTLVAFSSNEKEHAMQRGTFQIESGSSSAERRPN